MRAASSSLQTLMLAGVLLATALAYLRCLGNGFVFDDQWLIVDNSRIGNWSFLWQSLFRDWRWFMDPRHQPVSARYRPLDLIRVALNYHLFGLKPLGWHVAMVAAHLLVVWLVYKTALRLSGERNVGLLSALFFGLMPVHAEAVVWVSGFVLAMTGGFELGAFYLVMDRTRAWRRNWALALGLYGAALLSHEVAVTFPGMIAAYVFLLEAPGAAAGAAESGIMWRLRKAIACAAPFAAEVVLYLMARRLVLGVISGPLPDAVGLATVPGVLASYLLLLVVPWWAGPIHRMVPVLGPRSPGFYLPLAALAAVACAFLLAARNSPRRRLYLFCVAWIVVAMAPLMDLEARRPDQLVHDNFLYFASFAWCLMVADWAVRIARRGMAMHRLVWGTAAALAMLCALVLWHVQPLWHDEVALFTRAVSRFPESAFYRYHLATALMARGDLAAAERQYRMTLTMDPGSGDALYGLGTVHFKLGRLSEAETEIAQGLSRMRPPMERPPPAGYVILSQLREAAGDLPGAETQLRTALSLEPDSATVLYSLARVHARMGRIAEAASEIAKALELTPDAPADAYVQLAQLYDAEGEKERSEAVLKRIESMPGGAEAAGMALARIRASHGDAVGAEKIMRDLAGRYPGDQRVWTMLGLLLAGHGRDNEALDAYQRASALAPNDERPHFFAAQALHALGRDREALAECGKALAIDPAYADATALMAEIKRDSGPN